MVTSGSTRDHELSEGIEIAFIALIEPLILYKNTKRGELYINSWFQQSNIAVSAGPTI